MKRIVDDGMGRIKACSRDVEMAILKTVEEMKPALIEKYGLLPGHLTVAASDGALRAGLKIQANKTSMDPDTFEAMRCRIGQIMWRTVSKYYKGLEPEKRPANNLSMKCSDDLLELMTKQLRIMRPGLQDEYCLDDTAINAAVSVALLRAGTEVYMALWPCFGKATVDDVGNRVALALEQTVQVMIADPESFGITPTLDWPEATDPPVAD